MGVVINQSIKSSIVSYIGILIGAFNILWLYPKFLKPEEFGLLRLLQDIPFLFALFVQLGASSITDRFFHHFKDGQRNKGFLSLLLLYPLIGFSLFIISFFLFNDFWRSIFASKSTLLLDYFIYLLPLTFFMMYTNVMEAYLRANLKISWPNFVRDVLLRIFYSAFVFSYALKLVSFDGLMLLIVIGYGVSLFTIFLYTQKIKILHLNTSISLPDKKLQKEIGTYLLFLIPGTAGSVIAQKIDTIMLATISGLKENEGLQNIAIYSLAYFVSSVIEVPRKSISQISVPLLSAAFKEEDYNKIDILYKKNSITQFISGVFIFVLIWINIDYLFLFVPNTEVYQQGKYVILFIGLSKLFDMATSINSEIIQLSKFFKFNLIAIVLLSVLTIGLNFLFIPLYSITGAAIALAITIFLYNFIKTYYIWHKMGLYPFSIEILYIAGICIVAIIYTFISPFQISDIMLSFPIVLFQSLVFIGLFYFLIRKFTISIDLNNFIDKQLHSISEKTGFNWIKKL